MEQKNKDLNPFTFKINMDKGTMTNPDNHITRRLFSMKDQYNNAETYEKSYRKKIFYCTKFMKSWFQRFQGN